ncbi:MAG: tetratricopeptide repeat protein [Anaerolineae bacterium]|nr:tetratricopeptide repeat protein [Anaerolineae bacterium]
MAASYNRRFPTIVRYGSGIIIFFLFIGLGWRSAATVKTNALHLNLLHPVMQGESGELLELSDEVTGLTARAAAVLQPDEAQLWLENGLADYSQPLTALELCLWYWDEGRVADAAAACRESQGTTIYWIRQGIAAQIEDNESQAIAFFEMATQVEPESAEAWFRLGVMLQQEARYEEAIVAYREAVTHGYEAYDSLGAMYLRLGQLEEARQVLLEGISVYPDARYTYLHLAQVAEAEEKWHEADDWYRQLIEVAPDYGPGFSGRGRMAVRLGQYEQAVTYFQQATQVEPGRLGFWLELGHAAAQADDTTLAVRAYEQALLLQPDNAQAQAGLEALGQP